ncbi:hypothetical protein [Streptomyces kronopolitis]
MLDTMLAVAVDDDDPKLDDYYEVWEEAGHGFKLVVGPRLRIGPTLNKVGPTEASTSFAIGFMGDDHRPRTRGWDAAYVSALESGASIVYGDDLLQGPNIPTQVAVKSDIILATGKFVPDGMLHLYLDNVWKAWGEALGELRYLPQVVVEHMHPCAGKAEWDEGYAENNSQAVYSADGARYEEWKRNEMADWVAAIRRYRANSA